MISRNLTIISEGHSRGIHSILSSGESGKTEKYSLKKSGFTKAHTLARMYSLQLHRISLSGKTLKRQLKRAKRGSVRFFSGSPRYTIQGYRPDHTVVYWNEANTQIYGYTAEEAIGKDIRDLIVPDPARGEVTTAIARMVETGIPEPAAELELKRKDGSLVSIFSSHSVVKIPGRSTILYCIDIDLTERKRAEEALKNSEAYLKTIISSVQTGLVIIDPETHTIVDINPAAENLIGVKREGTNWIHLP